MVAQRHRAHPLGRSGERGAEVLEQERRARQRAVRERPRGLRARPLEQVADHRVEVARGLDARDRRVEQLERGRLAGAHERGVADQVEVREVDHQPTVATQAAP